MRALLSVLDLFRIGIGPSSSHTVGPIRIAKLFAEDLRQRGMLARVARVTVQLQGSLALTGRGHNTPKAVLFGLMGLAPETLDPPFAEAAAKVVEEAKVIALLGERLIAFDTDRHIIFATHIMPAPHPNGMKLSAYAQDDGLLHDETYYSTGGGFIATETQLSAAAPEDGAAGAPFPFASAAELIELCARHVLSIEEIIGANEDVLRSRSETVVRLDRIVAAMNASIERGLACEGVLPGGLKMRRRAPALWRALSQSPHANEPERLFDRLNVYAMAVNEENAAGGRVVTAPTNGAAGIIPALLRHYCLPAPEGSALARRFLLSAGGVGLLYKQRASISGAEMGCQGEVGVACSMAAAGLAAVWGASVQQIVNAAEIAMEHNLGLTCDPVGGLVQIPCIERNALGAVKAVNAARLALHSDAPSKVSLDQVIETMRQTGLDMSVKYKETSQGGLAVNVIAC